MGVEGAGELREREVAAVVQSDGEGRVGLGERREHRAAGERGVGLGERNVLATALGGHLGDHAGDGAVASAGEHRQAQFDAFVGDLDGLDADFVLAPGKGGEDEGEDGGREEHG